MSSVADMSIVTFGNGVGSDAAGKSEMPRAVDESRTSLWDLAVAHLCPDKMLTHQVI